MPSPWTDEELKALRENYASCGSNIPSLRARRTASSITNKASELGLTCEAGGQSYHAISYNDVTYSSASAACRAAGLPYGSLMRRYAASGAPIQEMFDQMVREKQLYGDRRRNKPLESRRCDSIIWDGKEFSTLKSACDAYGLNPVNVYAVSSSRKLTHQEAFELCMKRKLKGKPTENVKFSLDSVKIPEEFEGLADACRKLDVAYTDVYVRLRNGLSFEDAVSGARKVKRRGSRDTSVAKGCAFPVHVGEVECRSLKDAATALGITSTALSTFMKRSGFTLNQAIAHYQENGAHVQGRSSKELLTAHIAYTSDNTRYYFSVCKICGSVVLITESQVRIYRHGVLCNERRLPEEFLLSRRVAEKMRDAGYQCDYNVFWE